jgi:hypothetical protein
MLDSMEKLAMANGEVTSPPKVFRQKVGLKKGRGSEGGQMNEERNEIAS